MMKVKVCGLTNPENIREVIEAGTDYVGFIMFKGSKRYAGNISLPFMKAIPADVFTTGVFVNENIDTLFRTASALSFKVIQLHGNENPEYCMKVKNEGFLVIKTFGIAGLEMPAGVNLFTDVCDYFLFDTGTPSHGGSGRKFNWNLLDGYQLAKPFFLSGGIAPGDAYKIQSIKNDNLWGVDINSMFESEPGIKNSEKVREFIKEIKR